MSCDVDTDVELDDDDGDDDEDVGDVLDATVVGTESGERPETCNSSGDSNRWISTLYSTCTR